MKRALLFYLLVAISVWSAGARTIRILAIGNSFSQDAIEQNLYELARADGNMSPGVVRVAKKAAHAAAERPDAVTEL